MKAENIPDLPSCPVCRSSWAVAAGQSASRIIGIEYEWNHPAHYDGVSEWMCPDCKTRWSRWTNLIISPDL